MRKLLKQSVLVTVILKVLLTNSCLYKSGNSNSRRNKNTNVVSSKIKAEDNNDTGATAYFHVDSAIAVTDRSLSNNTNTENENILSSDHQNVTGATINNTVDVNIQKCKSTYKNIKNKADIRNNNNGIYSNNSHNQATNGKKIGNNTDNAFKSNNNTDAATTNFTTNNTDIDINNDPDRENNEIDKVTKTSKNISIINKDATNKKKSSLYNIETNQKFIGNKTIVVKDDDTNDNKNGRTSFKSNKPDTFSNNSTSVSRSNEDDSVDKREENDSNVTSRTNIKNKESQNIINKSNINFNNKNQYVNNSNTNVAIDKVNKVLTAIIDSDHGREQDKKHMGTNYGILSSGNLMDKLVVIVEKSTGLVLDDNQETIRLEVYQSRLSQKWNLLLTRFWSGFKKYIKFEKYYIVNLQTKNYLTVVFSDQGLKVKTLPNFRDGSTEQEWIFNKDGTITNVATNLYLSYDNNFNNLLGIATNQDEKNVFEIYII